MNYNETALVVDGYQYRFYTDLKYQNEMVAYAQMAKNFMNKPFNSPLDIVGNYDWHQAFPYEDYLFKDLENRLPLLAPALDESSALFSGKVIDFGCGPGRMIPRAQKLFPRVDGIDISEYAIQYAREHFKDSTFYISSGIDVGDIPSDTYDIAYSTIAIQHIPCKTIRENIFKGIYNILKPGGYMSIQVAYHPTRTAGVWSPDTEHASYDSDFWNAKATNGHADMVINQNDLDKVRTDIKDIFKGGQVKLGLANVDKLYANLNGNYHAPYWAESWLFIQARKE